VQEGPKNIGFCSRRDKKNPRAPIFFSTPFFLALPSLTLVFLVASSACRAFSWTLIAQATMAQDINLDRSPVGASDTFAASVPELHCIVRLIKNAPSDTKVIAKWSVVSAAGHPSGEPIFVSGQAPGGFIGPLVADASFGQSTGTDRVGNVYYDFTFKPSPTGLPPGEYKVDLFVNPDPTASGNPARTVLFEIE